MTGFGFYYFLAPENNVKVKHFIIEKAMQPNYIAVFILIRFKVRM